MPKRKYKSPTIPTPFRIPKTIKEAAQKIAFQKGMSLNEYVVRLMESDQAA